MPILIFCIRILIICGYLWLISPLLQPKSPEPEQMMHKMSQNILLRMIFVFGLAFGLAGVILTVMSTLSEDAAQAQLNGFEGIGAACFSLLLFWIILKASTSEET